jgi:GNAT superfamily N-acetyltransferase
MSDKKGTGIKIRPAEHSDASVIAELLYESFIGYRPMYTGEAFVATTPGTAEIENRIGNKSVFVALYNDVIAGTVSMKAYDKGLLIRSMAVLPVARGKGIARELLKHIEEVALKNGFDSLELTTTPFLFNAIRLYESLGFEQYGYDDLHGTPLIKMRKNLKSTIVSIQETQLYNN